ncbi:MAG TPA: DmsC/YnfH family molybdoenzyme membrane anchor subunit, partial [Burkholderiales bacterium]|nr:DmsC/YnfH family molybdoenzyme membrane anchor subunit [Burkholderiales bacterium]
MKPAWSVILFTTLAGAGQGLFLAIYFGSRDTRFACTAAAVSCALLVAGLVASFFHLGRPSRGWRAATMWRTSWLSREVIVLPLTIALVALFGLLVWTERWHAAMVAGGFGVAACLALFLCTGMIYACLRFLQEWHTPLTPLAFLAFGCASGLLLAAALAAALQPATARAYAAAALIAGALAYVVRVISLLRNRSLRPKSTLASATGVKGAPIRQISQGAMGGSYNTREFFHGRTATTVRLVRWTFLALVFPVPAALILVRGHDTTALAAAVVVQLAGLLAERWYFF